MIRVTPPSHPGAKPFSKRDYGTPQAHGHRYLVLGGYVRTPDGGMSHLSARRMAKLAGVDLADCVLWDEAVKVPEVLSGLIRIDTTNYADYSTRVPDGQGQAGTPEPSAAEQHGGAAAPSEPADGGSGDADAEVSDGSVERVPPAKREPPRGRRPKQRTPNV